jgi:hypothetical protein
VKGIIDSSSMSRHLDFLRVTGYALSNWWYSSPALFSTVSGVTTEPRRIPVIVSLTTIAERLARVPFGIEGLLRQTVKPDRLILWLDEKLARRVPALLRRQTRRGLEIRLVEDMGPHTKIIPALKAFPGCTVVTADDDVFYPKCWLGELLAAHEREPRSITCHRAHFMVTDEAGKVLPYRQWDSLSPGRIGPSLRLFPTGVSGVLYPPDALHPEVFNREIFQNICPKADDVWLKAMSLLNNVPCQKVRPLSRGWRLVRGTQHRTLFEQNVSRGQNDIQLQRVFEHYDLYPRLRAPDVPHWSGSVSHRLPRPSSSKGVCHSLRDSY